MIKITNLMPCFLLAAAVTAQNFPCQICCVERACQVVEPQADCGSINTIACNAICRDDADCVRISMWLIICRSRGLTRFLNPRTSLAKPARLTVTRV